MAEGIGNIALRHYDGELRKGPRHSYLIDELVRRGCSPTVDEYGNIWVEKGSGRPTVLFSSHIDVDYKIPALCFEAYEHKITGVLDNAVGVYLNLLLAEKGPVRGRAIYVFTASEEEDPKERFAKSAHEVLKVLKKRDIRPDLCVSVDVTYPALRCPADEIDWDKDYERIFDTSDTRHCFLDGFSRSRSRKAARSLARSFMSPKVAARDFPGCDEAHVYEKVSPAFAFGPVVYGHFDEPNQEMPLEHLDTALDFLRSLGKA